MIIAVLANDPQWQELVAATSNADWIRCFDEKDFFECVADVYINVMEDAYAKDYTSIAKPILIHWKVQDYGHRPSS